MTELERVRRNYRAAFLRYLPHGDEAALHAAYQIGRSAVDNGLSMLDLAQVHHHVLITIIRSSPDEDLDRLITAASDFLVEVLASYQLAQTRGVAD